MTASRRFLAGALGAIGTLGLSAGIAHADVEIRFFYPIAVNGPLTKIIDGYAQEFEASHPGIKVKPIYTGDYIQTIGKALTAVKGGDAPECAILLAADLYTLTDEDVVVPIEDLATTPEDKAWLNGFYPAYLENARVKGRIVAAPFQRSTPVLYWNKGAFKEAGLDPDKAPANWAEQLEFAKKLTKKDASGNVTQWGIQIPTNGNGVWLWTGLTTTNDVKLINGDGNKTDFNDPKAVDALDYLVGLSTAGVQPKGLTDWGSTPKDFVEGKVAMMWHTTGSLTNVRTNAKFPFGVGFLPAKAHWGAPTGGGNFYIFKGLSPEKQKATFEFVKFMTTPERAADWSIKTGYVAPSPAAWETQAMKDYVAKVPQAAVARDQLQYAVSELTAHDNQRVTKAANDALGAAMTGSKTPKAALDDAQKEADRILKDYR
ncbi:MAG: ABC transporter substrate-binding protein [Ancalomicrobiaceae bacterium]|nr:ABC transporter substrate-binding protein [Ancalomicrobiaceae bacterium]